MARSRSSVTQRSDFRFSRSHILGFFGVLLMTAMLLASCLDSTSNANSTEANTVNAQQNQYAVVQPVPFFAFSIPRQAQIDFYTAEVSHVVTTYTYIYNEYKNLLIDVCGVSATGTPYPTMSFPTPGGTQLTNPDSLQTGSGTNWGYAVAMPQAEPTGLYPPATAAATTGMCVLPNGMLTPYYMEPNLVSFTAPTYVNADGQFQATGQPSISIDPGHALALLQQAIKDGKVKCSDPKDFSTCKAL
jgi:hypothetical protein